MCEDDRLLIDEGSVAGFELERTLGRGGMGTVYLARHPRLPRLVALKLLDERMFNDVEARARFAREADLAARLDHPNIVAVYDCGVQANRPWIAMQYIQGTDAGAVGIHDPERAVQIISDVAAALDFAHGRGVLHRDVKPANILLGERTVGQSERVMLADFGIARLHFDQNPLTQTGTFTATLSYASPEQLAGMPIGPRADQYSLACTLYTLLTGAAPFVETNPVGLIQAHMSAEPPAISGRRHGLPSGLDPVLRRAMAKNVENRFGSCGEFAASVQQAFENPRAPMSFVPSVPASRIAPTELARPYPASAHRSSGIEGISDLPRPVWLRRNHRVAAIVAIVIVATAAAGIYVGTRTDSDSQGSQQARHYASIYDAFPELVGPLDSSSASGYRGAECRENSASWPSINSVVCISRTNLPFTVEEYESAQVAEERLASLGNESNPTRRESHAGCEQALSTVVFDRGEAGLLHVTMFPDDPGRSRFHIFVDMWGGSADQAKRMANFYSDWWPKAPFCR